MKRYLYVGAAGIFGSLARYFLSVIITKPAFGSFPLNTFIINITGCLILGFFLTIAFEFVEVGDNLKIAISTGFIGSFTTFSTFTNEVHMLFLTHEYLIMVLYYLMSFGMGMLSIILGTAAARRCISLFKYRKNGCEE